MLMSGQLNEVQRPVMRFLELRGFCGERPGWGRPDADSSQGCICRV